MSRPRIVINTQAYRSNLELLKELFQNKPLSPVIKANAYGHGAILLAEFLERSFSPQEMPYLCVARGDEALELREAGVSRALIVLSEFRPDDFASEFMKDIVLYLSNEKQVRDFLSLKKPEVIRGVFIHVNTGMNRLGFAISSENDRAKLKALVKELHQSGHRVLGFSSHLARAEEAPSLLSETQANLMLEFWNSTVMKWANELSLKGLELHFSNSAGICWGFLPEENCARPGLLSYGVFQDSSTKDFLESQFPQLKKLKPVAAVEAAVIQVSELAMGESASYGHRFTAKRSTTLATVAMGYADGVRRESTGKLGFVVEGEICPIVGTVTMDLCLIDITDHSNRAEVLEKWRQSGEVWASWIGPQQPVECHADSLGTISYEILCNLSARVQRLLENEEN